MSFVSCIQTIIQTSPLPFLSTNVRANLLRFILPSFLPSFPPLPSFLPNSDLSFVFQPHRFLLDNDIAGYSKPFVLNVHSDSQEGNSVPAESANVGFCLNFVQQPCTSSSG